MSKNEDNKNAGLISAFTEEQVEKITGITKSQLRYWDRTHFFSPSEFEVYRGQNFGRVYSFRDLTSLKILNDLRNVAKVPLQILRQLKETWDKEHDDVWTKHTLYAVNGRVVVDKEEGLEDAITKQRVLEIAIRAEYDKIKTNVSRLFKRDKNTIGKIDKKRNVSSNKPTIAGTRIRVKTIQAFADAGYSIDQIKSEFPTLKQEDIQAAITYKDIA